MRPKSPQEAAIANCHGGILRTHIEQHAPGRLEEITNAIADALAEAEIGTPGRTTAFHPEPTRGADTKRQI